MTVTADNPRQDAVDYIAGVWKSALPTSPDAAMQITLQAAQITALLYIGDAVNALREELRWATEHNQERS